MGELEQEAERAKRLTSLDGLRGVAAFIVMLYHFTLRYQQRFDEHWDPLFTYDGGFGVLLFFMISGYVITMTTRRIRRPIDFVFFRFSRLYPTFWVCMGISTLIMLAAQAPKPLPTPLSFVVNLTMLTKTIRRLPYTPNDIPYIDGSYWSLEIELFFYAVIFMLLLCRQAGRVVWLAMAMVVIGAIDHWMLVLGHSSIPPALRWVLFFDYWPYFSIGIALYVMRTHRQFVLPSVLLGLSTLRVIEPVVSQAIGVNPFDATVGSAGAADPRTPWIEVVKVFVCAGLFAAAVYDVSPPLHWRPVVALGAISYPLYLLHQNIGYVVIGVLHNGGVPADVAILLAIAVAILLATIVTLTIERPTMHFLRRLYQRFTHHIAPASSVSGLAPAVPVTPADRVE